MDDSVDAPRPDTPKVPPTARQPGEGEALGDKAKRLAEEQVEHARRQAETAGHQARAAYHDAADAAAEHFQNAKDRATSQFRDAATQVEDLVRREPVKAVLVAAGVGLVVGAILKR